MCIVAPPDRLTSAAVVFFGEHGDITRYARERDISRQSVYREAESVVCDLQGDDHQQEIDFLRQQCDELLARVKTLVDVARGSVVVSKDLQAEFACTAQAEGVSLPAARRLLAVFLRDKTPSVPQLGRFSRQAGLHSGPLLEVFDEHARPKAREAAADEIFFSKDPGLMTVEPESLCWLSGRLAPSRDGEEWAKELKQLPALEHLMRDGAKGIQNGLNRVNQEREEENEKSATDPVEGVKPQREEGKKKPITDQLTHFHTLREGRRALRKTQSQAEKAWSKAEEADKKVARQVRKGEHETGYATQAAIAWKEAEQAFHAWENAERILEEIRSALLPLTPEGELNTREMACQKVEALLSQLHDGRWDKFKRQVRQAETYIYLDRLTVKIDVLPDVEKQSDAANPQREEENEKSAPESVEDVKKPSDAANPQREEEEEESATDPVKDVKKQSDAANPQREEENEKSAPESVEDVKKQRDAAKKKPITDQLDHFHTLREGRRALRKTQSQAEKAWSKAEEADKKVARQVRKGEHETGYATQAAIAWKKAEQAFHAWENAERTLEEIRTALLPFTPEGELNTREMACQKVEALLSQLHDGHWDKFKRQVRQAETYTYTRRGGR